MGAILLMKDFFPGDDMEKCFAMEEGIAMEDIFQGEGWHLLGWLAILGLTLAEFWNGEDVSTPSLV